MIDYRHPTLYTYGPMPGDASRPFAVFRPGELGGAGIFDRYMSPASARASASRLNRATGRRA
jgi:hypothetical protein